MKLNERGEQRDAPHRPGWSLRHYMALFMAVLRKGPGMAETAASLISKSMAAELVAS